MAKPVRKATRKPAKKPAKKVAKKPAVKKAVRKAAAKKAAKKTRSVPELVAALADLHDWDSLTKGLRAIAKVATPEAHATLLDLSMNPPKHPEAEDLVIIAMDCLDGVLEDHPKLRELLLRTCETQSDHPRCCEPLCILINGVTNKTDVVKDRRLYALLRNAITDPNLTEARNAAIAVLMQQRDRDSLPLAVAALDRLGPEDGGTIERIADCMYALREVDTDGLTKLHAARDRLTDSLPTYVERTIERLAEML